jgi:hypothetical protein
MFRLIELSSGQIQNIVLVHSVSAHIMRSHIVYKIVLTLKIIYWQMYLNEYIKKYCVNVPVLCFIFGLMIALVGYLKINLLRCTVT